MNEDKQPDSVATTVIRPVPPRFHIVYDRPPEERPFEDQSDLVDRLFAEGSSHGMDPSDVPAERAAVCHEQIDMLLQHLAARHTISYKINRGIEYETSAVRSKLYELEQFSPHVGYWSRLETDLVKELQQLKKQQWSEEIACWRDTGRILGDIAEQWSDFANERRKSELMRIDD